MQTIWLPPRATGFVEACEACADDPGSGRDDAGSELRGSLAPFEGAGWATCRRGHAARVLRMGGTMPAGALR